MTEPVPRAVIEAFYEAYISRDPERIGSFLADDVEWYVGGPVEVMQVCGTWHGKAAVIDRFKRLVPQVVHFKKLDVDSLLIDGNCGAMFGRVSSIHRESGRLICHRTSNLVRFRDGKVAHFRVINDTLDAAEQYLGHRIDLLADPDGDAAMAAGDLIAV